MQDYLRKNMNNKISKTSREIKLEKKDKKICSFPLPPKAG